MQIPLLIVYHVHIVCITLVLQTGDKVLSDTCIHKWGGRYSLQGCTCRETYLNTRELVDRGGGHNK